MIKEAQENLDSYAAPRLPEGALYFVGIGGAGMSALAQVLAERGTPVAGADPGVSPAVRARLEAAGARVYATHDAAQLEDAAAVIVSDAIPSENPEVLAAGERGLPVLRRPELLGALVNTGRGIAIAGTHGKTTTTGMVAHILIAAGLDPTIFLGGDLPAIGGNARNGGRAADGGGEVVLAEACEAYDGFLYMQPNVAVVTNIEADHLDHHGTEAHVIASFDRFIRQAGERRRRDGFGDVILCWDDVKTRTLAQALPGLQSMNYGFDDDRAVDVQAIDLELGERPSFRIRRNWMPDEEPYGPIRLRVPGRHNVLNALAAASVAFTFHIGPRAIIEGLESFTGTGRRFEKIGEAGGVLIVDDYAHHPTEIRATLAAARAAYPERRLVAVFQPHLPSRTRDLMEEFADALAGADAVYLSDIYLAREKPIPGVTSEALAERVRAQAQAQAQTLPVHYTPDKNDLPERLAGEVQAGDLVLTMGAGDIRAAATGLHTRLAGK